MVVREVLEEEKNNFNQVVNHPLQSWEWGEFRKKTGVEVVRLGVFEKGKLIDGWQLTVHQLPKIPYTVIYFPRGPQPNELMLSSLKKIGLQKKAVFLKMEPNIAFPYPSKDLLSLREKVSQMGLVEGRSLFTRFSFWLDLTKSEEEILKAMKSKTRYNIRLAFKKGVEVVEDNSYSAFKTYLNLLSETTKRQGFYAHTPSYHYLLWETFKNTNIYHLFLAKYKKEVLAAYVFFVFKDFLYYPYGASTRRHREVMAPYALFWEAIRFGKQKGCRVFDMWGTPGPNPSTSDPWFGFHRFKEGFGSQLVEFLGTYDLVFNSPFYTLFTRFDRFRWRFLRLFSRFRQNFSQS